jgi:hypothetical protein
MAPQQAPTPRVDTTDNSISPLPRVETVPTRKVTTPRLRPQKTEQHHMRLTVDGDRIDYPGGKSTKNADLATSKCLWNSIVSTDKAMYMCADVKSFYLNTLLDRPEYMHLALNTIPQEIIDKYNLLDKSTNGYVYIRIDKGMYGLSHTGRLANNLLVKRLAPHG